MSETQERFLRAIAERIAPERIVAAHLFPAIRQGGVESGVAVIAAAPAAPAGAPALADAAPGPPGSAARHTVFTARYRLALKGAERGRWEFEAVAEADATLAAVEAVVRGVQRRAGESAAPERLTGEAFQGLLADASCPATTR